jgi:hypothetical protein
VLFDVLFDVLTAKERKKPIPLCMIHALCGSHVAARGINGVCFVMLWRLFTSFTVRFGRSLFVGDSIQTLRRLDDRHTTRDVQQST